MEGVVIYDIPLEEEEEEELPPQPIIICPKELEQASLVNSNEWHDRYKNAMGKAIQLCLKDINRTRAEEWAPVGSDPRVFMCEKTQTVPPNWDVIKIRAVLRGKAERYAYVMRDHNFETRGKWDSDVIDAKQLETYTSDEGKLIVVQNSIQSRLSNRSLLGVLFYHFTESTETHQIFFTTAPHPYYKCKSTETKMDATIGCVLRQLEKTEETEVIIVGYVNAGVGMMARLFLGDYKEKLRQRVYLYEKVVAKWDEYYGKNKKF